MTATVNSDELDLIVLEQRPEWCEDLFFGPAFLGGAAIETLDRLGPFLGRLYAEPHFQLVDYWGRQVHAAGDLPAYDRRWQLDLAAMAPHMYVRERLPGENRVRFRYVGSVIEERYGDMGLTGASVTRFNKLTEDEAWAICHPVFEEGRPRVIHTRYTMTGRSFLSGQHLELPLRDRATGEVRFALGFTWHPNGQA